MNLPVNYNKLLPSERKEIREEYVLLQDGKCWYCDVSLSMKSPHEVNETAVNWWRFPENFLRWPIHLHHDHVTGMTVGAVHAYCNAVSFDYDEKPLSC